MQNAATHTHTHDPSNTLTPHSAAVHSPHSAGRREAATAATAALLWHATATRDLQPPRGA
jgi:hypothetical protein